MPRRSSGGGSFRSSPRPTPSKSSSPRPTPSKSSSPRPAPAQGANSPVIVQRNDQSFFGAMLEGVGWGFGQRFVDSIMGPRTIRHEDVTPTPAVTSSSSDACDIHSKAFQDCINNSEDDINKCQYYMNMLSQCRKGSGGITA